MRRGSRKKKEGRVRKEEVVIEEQKEEKIIERMIQGEVENGESARGGEKWDKRERMKCEKGREEEGEGKGERVKNRNVEGRE